jgi:hypothetical protein
LHIDFAFARKVERRTDEREEERRGRKPET